MASNRIEPTGSIHRAGPVKPVRMEVNWRGGWKSIIGFDGADEAAAEAVKRAAITLCRFGGGVWRICSDDALPQPLAYLHCTETGWEAVQ